MGGYGHHRGVCGAQTAVEFEGEDEVAEFRFLVGAHWRIAFDALQIVEVKPPTLVRNGGDGDDAWSVGRFRGGQLERRHQERSESEGAEDIGAELQVEPVGGFETFWRS